MQKSLLFVLSFALSLLIFSCGSNKTEGKKPAISEELQKQLDETEKMWTQLTIELSKWHVEFTKEKNEWIASRPMDSIEFALEKNSTLNENLAESWKQLYEQAEARPANIEKWAESKFKRLKVWDEEATDFSRWKNEAESGKVSEKEIELHLKNQVLKIQEATLWVNGFKIDWHSFRETDKARIQSLRTLF
jgi:hypothetical protein